MHVCTSRAIPEHAILTNLSTAFQNSPQADDPVQTRIQTCTFHIDPDQSVNHFTNEDGTYIRQIRKDRHDGRVPTYP